MTMSGDDRIAMDEALQVYREEVSVPDPTLDTVFAAVRDAFESLGIGPVSSDDARRMLILIQFYLSAPEESRVPISAYLGTLLEPVKGD